MITKPEFISATQLNTFRMQKDTKSLRVYIGLFADKHYKATNRLASQDFELPTKVNFLGKLINTRIRNKVTQSKEFQDFDKFSLQDCFRAALEQEGIGMVSEAVNMTATATPKIMATYQEQHERDCGHQHQVNEVTDVLMIMEELETIIVGSVVILVTLLGSVLEILQKVINLNQIQWLQMQKLISLGLYQ